MSSVQDKPKEDRIRETIRLLKGLQANGLTERDGNYRAIKDLMSVWVENGEPVDTTVDLFRQNRIAHISLPKGSDRPATIALKVIKENDLD